MSDKLPDGWLSATLGEITEINPRHPKGLPDGTKVSFVRMAGLSEFSPQIGVQDQRALGEVRSGFTHFAEGDVLFAKITPCMENGKGAVATGLVNGLGCGTTELHVIRPPRGLNPLYVYRFLGQQRVRREAKENFTGTAGQARVPTGFIEDLNLPIAPESEQGRIIAKLEKLLARADACTKRLEQIPLLIKRFRQAVLAAACSGRLTADWREQIGDGVNVSPEHGLPELWKNTTLDQCCVRVIDGNYGAEYPKAHEFVSEGIPFLTSAAIGVDGKIVYSELKFITPEKHATLRKAQTTVDDVVFTNRGARVGATALLIDSMFSISNIGPQVTRLAADRKILLPNYLFYWMRTPHFHTAMIERNGGSAMNFLNLTTTKALPILLPPIREQTEIVGRIDHLFSFADKLEARYAKAKAHVDKLTQSILAKAFRGELVPQDPKDEPASVLLERIKAERHGLSNVDKPGEKRRRRK